MAEPFRTQEFWIRCESNNVAAAGRKMGLSRSHTDALRHGAGTGTCQ